MDNFLQNRFRFFNLQNLCFSKDRLDWALRREIFCKASSALPSFLLKGCFRGRRLLWLYQKFLFPQTPEKRRHPTLLPTGKRNIPKNSLH